MQEYLKQFIPSPQVQSHTAALLRIGVDMLQADNMLMLPTQMVKGAAGWGAVGGLAALWMIQVRNVVICHLCIIMAFQHHSNA